MDKALSGTRIIDMTHNQAGPACAQILAFLGADVIKLEEPKGGDVARRNMRDRADSDSLFFLLFNANKRSLSLNLKTGRGQQVEVSLQDAVVNLIRVSLRDHQRFGEVMPRRGNQMGRGIPGTTYPCAPGGPNDYAFITAQQQMWPAFTAAIGRPELATDPRFAREEARWENRAALNAIIEEWTGARTKHEVMRILGAAGVPCGACQDTGEVLADPHLKAREMILDIDYPTRGTYKTVGCPIKLSDSSAEVTRPPLLGEHTEVLLDELCGIDPQEFKRLHEDGVV